MVAQRAKGRYDMTMVSLHPSASRQLIVPYSFFRYFMVGICLFVWRVDLPNPFLGLTCFVRFITVTLELLYTISTMASTIAGMADDLIRVKSFLANVVQGVVEQTRQFAEGLGLEVVLLVSLLALFHFILQSIQSLINRILQVVESLRYLLLDDVQPCREVSGRQCSACQQEEAGEDALNDDGKRMIFFSMW